MTDVILDGLKPVAAKKFKPFIDEILGSYYGKIHSIHVTGTAITDDFDEKISDVNSVFVLKQMDLKFLEVLAPLGKKYGKQKVAAPLIMTPDYMRQQCERELKAKLIWLRQGYISSAGDKKMLTEGFVNSITGYIPLFRGITYLLGKEPPVRQKDVISTLSQAADINTDIFDRVLKEKLKLSIEDLNSIFENYYTATENLGKIVDEIKE